MLDVEEDTGGIHGIFGAKVIGAQGSLCRVSGWSYISWHTKNPQEKHTISRKGSRGQTLGPRDEGLRLISPAFLTNGSYHVFGM